MAMPALRAFACLVVDQAGSGGRCALPEIVNPGGEPACENVRREPHDRLFTWFRRRRNRTETPEEVLFAMGPEHDKRLGITLGRW